MTLPSAVSLIFDRARWSFSDGGQEKKRRRKIREMNGENEEKFVLFVRERDTN
jgi:hypothetical protein